MKFATYSCIFVLVLFHSLPAFSKEYKIGTWKTAQTIQPFYYEKYLPENAKASVLSFTNPADQKTALLAGSLDMCGTTLAHAIHSASMGQPVVIVCSLCNKCSALVVKKDGPVKSVKDLTGKKIGYVPGTMHEILLRETLQRNNISPEKDVILMRIDFFDMGLALAKGGIDAFLSGEPFPTIAQAQGYGKILSYPYYDESVGEINAGMLVSQATIEKKPEIVYALVKAHIKSTQYLNNHKSEWLQKASEFGTSFAILEKASCNMELAWDMTETFVNKAKALGKRMQSLGVISIQPDYDRLFDLSFVTRYKTGQTGI